MQFHAKHKYAIMAHCQNGLRDLGRLVANNRSAKTQGGVVRQTLTRQKKSQPGTSPTQHKALSIRKVNCFSAL